MLEDKVIVFQKSHLDSSEEALDYVSHLLLQSGAVKESYPNAIQEREKAFPTGLMFSDYGVAIPHTDIEHVNYSQMAIVSLKNPVVFQQMGKGEDVEVNIIFMLALKEAHQQVDLLSQLIELFQNKVLLKTLLALGNERSAIDQALGLLKAQGIE
ncbi:PTS sugar transporter subunit IIA [Streptococcus agalactiae]|uniref:PTS sugar transporter subunit IIA n=1 Tax=Streptococcus agalactiae TaxID=1311 RepID=UPI003FEE4103